MTILFMGGEMAAFTPSDNTVVEDTTGTYYNSSFARCAILIRTDTSYAEGMPSASSTTPYLHFDMLSGFIATNTPTTRLSWYDSSGNERVRLKYATNTALQITISYWNGASFTDLTPVSVAMETRQTIDLAVVCNSGSGSIKLYISGTERLNSGAIDTTGIANLKKFRFVGGTVSGLGISTLVSQVVMADEPTIGWRLMTRYPNAAGATSDWTGAYTDIDEAVYDDSDFILSASNNQVSVFSQTGPSITGYTVRAVAVAARARRGASGPQNLRMALRSAGTNYFSGSDIAQGVGYAPSQTIWETDPATSAAWVNTNITSLQPGVKSIA
jgi:hypothetical protein